MASSSPFRKLPQCDYCLFYRVDKSPSCSVHLEGVAGDDCLDFREDDTAAKCWSQFLGLDWSNDEELDAPADDSE